MNGFCTTVAWIDAVGDALSVPSSSSKTAASTLPFLPSAFERRRDGRAVVAPQADDQVQVGMRVDDVLDVRAGLGAIGVVLALLDDLDLVAGDGVLHALEALRGVVGREACRRTPRSCRRWAGA